MDGQCKWHRFSLRTRRFYSIAWSAFSNPILISIESHPDTKLKKHALTAYNEATSLQAYNRSWMDLLSHFSWSVLGNWFVQSNKFISIYPAFWIGHVLMHWWDGWDIGQDTPRFNYCLIPLVHFGKGSGGR